MSYFISSNPNDQAYTTFPKIVVLLAMLFAEITVLLLPLDVGNRSGVVGCGFWNDSCGGLDMVLVWEIVYCAMAILVVMVVPFTIFYYEAASEHTKGKERFWWTATKYMVVTTLVCVGLLVVGYSFLRQTYIPMSTIAVDVTTVAFGSVNNAIVKGVACGSADGCKITSSVLKYDVTFVIYMAALLSFAGWFLFAIYSSIGLVAVPLDFLHGYIHRRKYMSPQEVAGYKLKLKERTEIMMQAGEKLKEEWENLQSDPSMGRFARANARRKHNIAVNKFRVLVEALEDENQKLQLSNPQNFNNQKFVFLNHIWPYLSIVFFILSVIITILWLCQIIIYMLLDPPVSPFLNDYLTWFDTWFPLFGTLTVALFAFYLLFAVIKGINKFGTRFALMSVYPMKPHATLMNSFLFNAALVLLCAMPVSQFCTEAFAAYARLTDADVIFGSQVRNLQFFRLFFQNNVFLYAMLVICFLSLVYFVMTPSAESERAKDAMVQLKVQLTRKNALELKRIKRSSGR